MPETQDSKTSGRKTTDSKTDDTTSTVAATADTGTPGNEEAPAVTTAADYEPYPGPEFFHGGRNSAVIAAMGRRLRAEGAASERLGPDWTRAHQRAFEAWQRTLRPKGGGDTTGIPDRVAWEKLEVPRVSPRTEA